MIPAASLGFSLTSPADNVFVGFTSEVFENIHVFVGAHNGKVTERIVAVRDEQGAEQPIENDNRDPADPKTRQVRKWNIAYGVTFNLNIITTFFK
jgi:hypothetical protein